MAKTTVYMTGKVYWAKIIGDPRPNYSGDAREWAFEFEPDEEGVKILKQHKIADRLKDKYEDQGRGKFITLKKSEFTKDGRENTPIRVYNSDDEPWGTDLIGNGTVVNLKADIVDYGPGKKKGIYPGAVRVQELVKYESSEFGAFDAAAGKAPAKKKAPVEDEFNLNDDVPF